MALNFSIVSVSHSNFLTSIATKCRPRNVNFTKVYKMYYYGRGEIIQISAKFAVYCNASFAISGVS